jgi:hypothetical protein
MTDLLTHRAALCGDAEDIMRILCYDGELTKECTHEGFTTTESNRRGYAG